MLQGDYIAAYPHAYIHFHGTRTDDEEITAEKARNLQKALSWQNQTAALALSDTVFDRLFSNYAAIQAEVKQTRNICHSDLTAFDLLLGDGTIDVPAFAVALTDHVRSLMDNDNAVPHAACSFRRVLGLSQKNKNSKTALPPAILEALKTKGLENLLWKINSDC